MGITLFIINFNELILSIGEDMAISKVAISYAWENKSHQDWVIKLAKLLLNNGIDVVIDIWDLKEGQDENQFMEYITTDDSIKKVLIVLTKEYQRKANIRKDGVGVETLIISNYVYNNSDQTKFIPIIKERDENNQPYLPNYLKGRIYIDLSNPDVYESGFVKLLDCILGVSRKPKPPINDSNQTYANTLINDNPIASLEIKTQQLKEILKKDKEKHPNLEAFVEVSETFTTLSKDPDVIATTKQFESMFKTFSKLFKRKS